MTPVGVSGCRSADLELKSFKAKLVVSESELFVHERRFCDRQKKGKMEEEYKLLKSNFFVSSTDHFRRHRVGK